VDIWASMPCTCGWYAGLRRARHPQPWRVACAWLTAAGATPPGAARLIPNADSAGRRACPERCGIAADASMGRLFDASALCGCGRSWDKGERGGASGGRGVNRKGAADIRCGSMGWTGCW
jgi:hypothetical protein